MSCKGNPEKMNFACYDAFGFDLDHTIAKYKLVALFNTVYDCVTDFLVNQKNYDPAIKGDLVKYKDFVCKGLFLDARKGNILKLSHDGTILRATHGTHLLSKADLQQVYGEDMKWELTETVKKTLRNPPTGFRFFENYFDCPGLVATARIIDIIDQKSPSKSAEEKADLYSTAWDDTLESLYYIYSPAQFSAGKGGYFPVVEKDTSYFVEKCSADIRRWLRSLREQGKVVFLLTSSQIDYASCLLEICLGKDWQSYFDISLFHARKPAFFTDNNPFYALDDGKEGEVVTQLEKNGCYSQGNIDGFKMFLSKLLSNSDPQVLYFGDNICADSYPSKHFAQWGTVLILEEMDAEGYLYSDGTVPSHENDRDDGSDMPSKKKKVLEHSSLVTEEEIGFLTSEFWGSLLSHQNGKTAGPIEMNTFWGDVIGQYCDIAVPSLEYLAGVPLDHNFDMFSGSRTNIGGFHPGRPSSLLP